MKQCPSLIQYSANATRSDRDCQLRRAPLPAMRPTSSIPTSDRRNSYVSCHHFRTKSNQPSAKGRSLVRCLPSPKAILLIPLFLPQSVAVIGASERAGSVGRSVLWNLLSNPFGGTVFPVNAKRPNVLGIKAYPSVSRSARQG